MENNELKLFQNEEFGALGVLAIDGKVWFPATDSARILGYTNPHKAINDHCRYLTKREVPHPQNPDKLIQMNFISEGDLYRLIVRSKLPTAERFERWVFDEVLPSLRKYGAYAMQGMEGKIPIPQTLPEALRLAADLADQCQTLNTKCEVLNTENTILSQQVLRWDDVSFINAAVRKYASILKPKYSDKFTFAWNCFRKELLYRYGINLKMRKTEYINRTGKTKSPKITELLSQEETPLAISTIVAMCREADIDISDLLKNIDVAV